ncbi:hypothetical protein TNIN_111941 [Trichonephila inaurata madagascariensis]|uniref:Uncharacterized protein n=1 Tax=Trichonephila inaurata madagascariensis TaxID=2747483 RepID=A0A8X7BWX5_9ARAC|nr:hypothetical protein TNIN_111941 [Trichonephila inaurata madagascariensis]
MGPAPLLLIELHGSSTTAMTATASILQNSCKMIHYTTLDLIHYELQHHSVVRIQPWGFLEADVYQGNVADITALNKKRYNSLTFKQNNVTSEVN